MIALGFPRTLLLGSGEPPATRSRLVVCARSSGSTIFKGETDAVHGNLVATFKDLEDHVHGLEFGLAAA
ncbi:hypothetical protein L1987_05946 [Smallanthus sonchifolius]|uniref:Uncharacterized protein n=1 Tax=Smallanthus sonchifolius TaxID=185202 RepID=A0ACB9JWX1_9ASTR|nr:hypothetical protein L1987_05946 [Smallanthus sonchifolius]